MSQGCSDAKAPNVVHATFVLKKELIKDRCLESVLIKDRCLESVKISSVIEEKS